MTASDPYLLIQLKSTRNTVPVPVHWSQKKRYLGGKIIDYHFPDDSSKTRWTINSRQYIKEAIRNVENELKERDKKLPGKFSTPMTSGY